MKRDAFTMSLDLGSELITDMTGQMNPPADGGRWAAISELPAYEVNEVGEVRRASNGRHLSAQFHKSGYWHVQMTDKCRPVNRLLQRLVAIAFIGQPPSEQHQAAHLDGDTSNNYWRNLAWKTPKENCADREVHGTVARGSRNGKLRHSDSVVLACREMFASGVTTPAIAEKLNIPLGVVHGYATGARRPNAGLEVSP